MLQTTNKDCAAITIVIIALNVIYDKTYDRAVHIYGTFIADRPRFVRFTCVIHEPSRSEVRSHWSRARAKRILKKHFYNLNC